MKFEIDLTKKTIKVEKAINLGELETNLEKLFPGGAWKEFELLTNVTINWNSSPIVIERNIYPRRDWWNQPYYGQPYVGAPNVYVGSTLVGSTVDNRQLLNEASLSSNKTTLCVEMK